MRRRWCPGRCVPGRSLMQAELVALRITHDGGHRPAVAVRLDQLRTELLEPFDFGELSTRLDMDVEVHPVLGDLGLGYTLEEQPRLQAPGVAACRRDRKS